MTRAFWLACAMLVVAAPAAWGAEPPQAGVSEANELLFQTNHFEGIEQPAVIRYEFEKGGSRGGGFADSINMRLSEGQRSDTKRVELRYFTGERNQYVPAVPNARGNPVLMVFLQRDINEMRELTGGHWRYFQKAIKTALAGDAQAKPVTFELHGNQVEGQQVRIEPYRGDAHLRGKEALRDKLYVFTLSDSVPGGIYELRSVVPGVSEGEGQSQALLEETLTFEDFESKDP